MFCKKCGNEIPDNAITCQNCGCNVNDNPLDSGNLGYSLLGCCIPIAGLILYFVWKDQKPKNAKRCIQGFFVSVIIFIIYYVLVFGLTLFLSVNL